jgi:hypothetical protein
MGLFLRTDRGAAKNLTSASIKRAFLASHSIMHGSDVSFTTNLTTVVKDVASGRRWAEGRSLASFAARSRFCQIWPEKLEERARSGASPFFYAPKNPKKLPSWQLAR